MSEQREKYQDPPGTKVYGMWEVFREDGSLSHYRGNNATHYLRLFPVISGNAKSPKFDLKTVPMNAEQRAKAAEYEQRRQQNNPQQGQQRQQAPPQQRPHNPPPQQQQQNYQPSQPQYSQQQPDQYGDLGVTDKDSPFE